MSTFRRFIMDETGATSIEYALIASLIALSIIGGAKIIGTDLNAKFTGLSGNLK